MNSEGAALLEGAVIEAKGNEVLVDPVAPAALDKVAHIVHVPSVGKRDEQLVVGKRALGDFFLEWGEEVDVRVDFA